MDVHSDLLADFWKLIKKLTCKKVLIPQRFCGETKHDTAVGADNHFAVFSISPNLLQISTTSDHLHKGKQYHHSFGADATTVCIDWTAIGASIFISNFLPVSTIALCMIAAKKVNNLDFEFILFIVPFFHKQSSFGLIHYNIMVSSLSMIPFHGKIILKIEIFWRSWL